MANKFVVIEGIDCPLLEKLSERLVQLLRSEHENRNLTFSHWLTSESTTSVLGREVADWLEKPGLHPQTKALLVEASRIQGLAFIKQAIEKHPHTWFFLKGFTDSSHAYLGHGEGVKEDLLEDLDFHREGLEPTTTVFFNLNPDTCFINEKDDKEYLRKVNEGFWNRVQYCPSEYYVVEARDIDDKTTVEQIDAKLKELVIGLCTVGKPPSQQYGDDEGFHDY